MNNIKNVYIRLSFILKHLKRMNFVCFFFAAIIVENINGKAKSNSWVCYVMTIIAKFIHISKLQSNDISVTILRNFFLTYVFFDVFV